MAGPVLSFTQLPGQLLIEQSQATGETWVPNPTITQEPAEGSDSADLKPQSEGHDWPTWRGTRYDGSSQVTGLQLGPELEKHQRWSTALPGPAACTPIVLGTRIFLTAAVAKPGDLQVLCLDRLSGSILWQESVGSGYKPFDAGELTEYDYRSNYASPSPVSDGKTVVFLFGNGDMLGFTVEGKEIWRRNLQKDLGNFQYQWTFSATPTWFEGLLILPVLQRDVPVNNRGKEGNESYLLGIDPLTGKTVYRHVRPCDAKVESRESFATAIPHRTEAGKDELLIVGGDVLTSHNPRTGKEFWRWGTWNPGHREQWWRVVPSPVIGGGVALVCAPKGAPAFAIKLGGTGELGPDSLAWQSSGRGNPVTSDVPTPLFYEGHFYVVSDLRSALTKLDPSTGEKLWSVPLPRDEKWRASPTGADGRVWCMDHGGLVLGVELSKGEIVSRGQLGAGNSTRARSSIAAAHGCLFVRTDTHLICLGPQQ